MNIRSVQLLCLTLVAAYSTCPSSASAQGDTRAPRRTTKVVSFSKAENVRELYVAVVGAVATPGTYQLDPSEINLRAVIQRAGGMTPDAINSIGVIRQGRLSHLESDSTGESTPLSPGDLLVVQSRFANSTAGQVLDVESEPDTIHASYQERSGQSGVQIALLNVLDYPVVLTMRPEEATVTHIARGLGQSPEILKHVTVVAMDPAIRRLTEQARQTIQLTGGSAIVFDRGAIDRSKLPGALPKPFQSEISQGAKTALIDNPHNSWRGLHSLGEQALTASTNLAGSSNPNSPSTIAGPTATEILPSDDTQQSNPIPSESASQSRVATLPSFTGEPRFTRSSIGNPVSDSAASNPIPTPEDASSQTETSGIETAAPLSPPEPEAVAVKSFSYIKVMAVLLITGALIGTVLLVSRALQSKEPIHPFAPSWPLTPVPAPKYEAITAPAVAHTSLLEQLINNELPIALEAVEFPSELVLQGRIAARPMLRVDGPQDVLAQNGPHFESSDDESSGYALREVTAQVDSAEKQVVRRPHFLSGNRQPAETSAVAAPVPSESIGSKLSDRTDAPLAKALFELDQGGHS